MTVLVSRNKKTVKNSSFDEYFVNCEKNLAEYTNIVKEYQFALNNFFSKFNIENADDYTFSLEILRQAVSEKSIATARLKEIQAEILTIEKE